METIQFQLKDEYIELIQLLKAINIAQSGGEAKVMVDSGMIIREGIIETRRRAKIRPGEEIYVENKLRIIIK